MRRALVRFEEHLGSLLLAAMLAVMTLQVFTRYVLNDPFSWTEEALRYLYVYLVFFGASAAISDRSHVGISFLVHKLPPAARLGVAMMMNLLILGFLANLIYWGIRATQRNWTIPLMTIEIPYAVVYVVVPVTAALMAIRTVLVMREDWRRADARDDDAQRSVI